MPSDLPDNQEMQAFLSPQAYNEGFPASPGLLRRQRASTDYVRPAVRREIRARASIDIAAPSWELADTPLGRHDSTASADATIGVPIIARRYRATSIDITRHTERQRSLPLGLPRLRSQPSLLDDLADFVHPSMESENLQGEMLITSPTGSVPSISITSTPTMGHALPVATETIAKYDLVTESTLQSTKDSEEGVTTPEIIGQNQEYSSPEVAVDSQTCESFLSKRTNLAGIDCTPAPMYQHCWPSSASLSSGSPATLTLFEDDEPVLRPSSQRPSRRTAKRTSLASSNLSIATSPSPTTSTIFELDAQPPATPLAFDRLKNNENTNPTPFSQPSSTIVVENAYFSSQRILPNPKEITADLHDEAVLSVLRRRLKKHVPTHTLALESGLPSLPSTSSSGENWEQPAGNTTMSSQAKRRAAQARRMHLAFGKDDDNQR